MRSEMGLWLDEIDPYFAKELTESYVRRKTFEAQLIALEVGYLFSGKRVKEISTEEMYASIPGG